MTKRVKKYADTLKYLAYYNKASGKSIINSAEPELVNCFSDICYNILNGKVTLSQTERNKLAKYKSQIRKIANKRTTQKTKKTLIQKGGFLSALLGPLLGSIIVPLAKGLFGVKRQK